MSKNPDLTAVAHNIWSVGNRDPRGNLRELTTVTAHPEVLALQEAKRFSGTVPYYRRVALGEGHAENDNCVLLVRDDVRIVKERFLRVNGPVWVGPKHGIKHPPRVYPWIVGEPENGQRFEAMSIHRTPGGPDPHIKVNAESWAAEHRALRAWLKRRQRRHPERPILALGDWNDRWSTRHPLSVSSLASEVGGALWMRGIDGVLGLNVELEGMQLRGLYGSDGHRPVLTDVYRTAGV